MYAACVPAYGLVRACLIWLLHALIFRYMHISFSNYTLFFKQLDSGVRAQLLKVNFSLRAHSCLFKYWLLKNLVAYNKKQQYLRAQLLSKF